MKVGFIGLGTMGGPMALNCRTKGGFEMIVHDLRRETSLPHVDAGASWSDDVGTLAKAADVVLTSLPGPKEAEAVAQPAMEDFGHRLLRRSELADHG